MADQLPKFQGPKYRGPFHWLFFWIDPNRGIAGVILMQYLPFADVKALATYDAFEGSAYHLVSAER